MTTKNFLYYLGEIIVASDNLNRFQSSILYIRKKAKTFQKIQFIQKAKTLKILLFVDLVSS